MCVCVYVRTQECRFHIPPDNEIKEVPSEKRNSSYSFSLLRRGEHLFLSLLILLKAFFFDKDFSLKKLHLYSVRSSSPVMVYCYVFSLRGMREAVPEVFLSDKMTV